MNEIIPVNAVSVLPALVTASGDCADIRFWNSLRPTSATRTPGALRLAFALRRP
jgi:hypothetical protein